MSITFHNKLLGLSPDAYYGGGGKGGPAAYQGPTAQDLENQKQMYRSQWDKEANLEEQEILLAEEKSKADKANAELEGRTGIKEILANTQKGFTKKDDEDGSGLLGIA